MNTRTNIVIVSVLLPLLLLLSTPLQAGGRRRVVTASRASSGPAIEFLDTRGTLDAGTIVWKGGKRSTTVQTRTVAMRIGPASHEARGTATLHAFLEISDPRATVRVNGVTLGNGPRIVQRHVPIGIATNQRIEIEVPTSAADGALQLSIGWEVITD